MDLTEETIKKILLYKEINEMRSTRDKDYKDIIEKLEKQIKELESENKRYTEIIKNVNYKIFPIKKSKLGKYYKKLKKMQLENRNLAD